MYSLCIEISCFIAYQQPFAPVPSQPCVGDAVTLPCEILVTENGTLLGLLSATITRDGIIIRANNIPNHMLLEDGRLTVIGIVINGVTLDDNGILYNCSAPNAPGSFFTSLVLNVTGTHTRLYSWIHMCVCMYVFCVT